MKRMSGVDAAFWYGETPAWHMHIGAVAIHETVDAPDFSFEAVRKIVIERLPQMRQLVLRLAASAELVPGRGPTGRRGSTMTEL